MICVSISAQRRNLTLHNRAILHTVPWYISTSRLLRHIATKCLLQWPLCFDAAQCHSHREARSMELMHGPRTWTSRASRGLKVQSHFWKYGQRQAAGKESCSTGTCSTTHHLVGVTCRSCSSEDRICNWRPFRAHQLEGSIWHYIRPIHTTQSAVSECIHQGALWSKS